MKIKDTFVIHTISVQLDRNHSLQWTFSTVTQCFRFKPFHLSKHFIHLASLITLLQIKDWMDFQNTTFYSYHCNQWQRLEPNKQLRQGEPMTDGSWQEVIYNLSLPCASVRQRRQTERDKERHKEKDAHRTEGWM